MKKTSKILSAFLALVMVFAMAVPAFAADAPHDVDIVSNTVTWENHGDRLPDDCKLTANGVIGQEAIQPKYFASYSGIVFDVVVGGGYTLDMGFPSGRDRYYTIYMDLVLLNGEPLDEVGPYLSGLPSNYADTAAPQRQYVFTCPDSMVSKPGAELLYHVWLDWGDGEPGSDYTTHSGNVQFWLRVNPAQSTTTTQPTTPVQPTTPTQPSTPAQPAQPSTPTTAAKPAPGASVPLNDGSGEFLYTIKSGDTLSGIAAYYYGKADVYKLIYERNKDAVKNANTIYAGQTIILPSYAAVAKGVAKI